MILIIMGVSGAGKTRIGKLLARRLGWPFLEGDEYHPAENIRKMKAGIPLTDKDRVPWLKAIQEAITKLLKQNRSAVIACSALKESHRRYLLVDHPDVRLVFLKGEAGLIEQRLKKRKHHFFDRKLLPTQLEILEEPKNAITVSIAASPQEIVKRILKLLHA